MSVILNEAALERLLESEDGPIGRDLARRVEQVKVAASENAARIVPIAAGFVDSEVHVDGRGLVGTVGSDESGRISRYLSQKAQRERDGGWLTSALAAFDP